MESELIALLKSTIRGRPMRRAEIEAALGIQTPEAAERLSDLLRRLEAEGKIVRTRAGRYGLPEMMNLVRGTIEGHRKGFAFLIPDTPGEPDVYIHPGDLNGAWHGDRVLVRINRPAEEGRRMEGEVVRILARAKKEIVGTFHKTPGGGAVVPDDRRIGDVIFVPPDGTLSARQGDKVVVRIERYPTEDVTALGRVVEILGAEGEPGVDIRSIIRKYELPEAFPDDVLAEARALPQAVLPEERIGRRDLTALMTVTIDGEEAKDFDDAVSLEVLGDRLRLYVHIADVAHYVREGTALDREAYRRGTSIYLVDRVIPMLPPELSNGIASLNPGVDRLAITCEMTFDRTGRRLDYVFYPSVIRSDARLTYTDVNRLLREGAVPPDDPLHPFAPMLLEMAALSERLRARRIERGALDFDLEEPHIVLDDRGRPIDVRPRERDKAEMLIEDFMLAANETVAEHIAFRDLPFLYRIHEPPDPEKIQAFLAFISAFGYIVRGAPGRVQPRALQAILNEARGEPEEAIIAQVLLRSMQQARYAATNEGHFGLAAEYYTHFTAPIRRYPDLVVHRLIRRYEFDRDLDPTALAAIREALPDIAEQSSIRERVAMEAERETDALKMAEYMAGRIGDEFDAVISGVTSFGLFVRLPNTIEGLVHVSTMGDDYYHFHERQYALIGEHTGKTYRLGDPVRVRCVGVNIAERTVDFVLVEEGTAPARRRSEGRVKVIRAARPVGDQAAGSAREKGSKKKRGRSRAKKHPSNPDAAPPASPGGGRRKKRSKR
ncbi:MAG: ribonuclease R [Hydrogenibacillus schlegelii]|uniref:Ribonuclease R n=2 Tax=Hydrogenibacillus schlegelii TaxID=1484 RepID=A0A947D1R8_HYDSH|nr:ribonuclease R [Hydrogenibacillus schlegelii]